MTDKEKEAIDKINTFITIIKSDFRTGLYYKEYLEAIETVLNLIQTQQTEIKKKDKQINTMAGYICATAYDNIIKKLKDDDIAYWGVEGSVKQYFERKAKNG